MKKILFIFIITLFACSREEKKEKIEVRLTLCNNNTICISITNNTKKKLFFPEIRGLFAGLRLFAIDNKNSYIDISDNVKIWYLFNYHGKNYESIKKHCKLSDHMVYLNDYERDSIASAIVRKDNPLYMEIKSRASHLMLGLVFIEPDQSFNDYCPISDSIKFKKIIAFYAYPYPYPVIRTGTTAISEEQIKYNKKLMDSLHFEYPKYIKGYELYDRPIYSEAVVINLE